MTRLSTKERRRLSYPGSLEPVEDVSGCQWWTRRVVRNLLDDDVQVNGVEVELVDKEVIRVLRLDVPSGTHESSLRHADEDVGSRLG